MAPHGEKREKYWDMYVAKVDDDVAALYCSVSLCDDQRGREGHRRTGKCPYMLFFVASWNVNSSK